MKNDEQIIRKIEEAQRNEEQKKLEAEKKRIMRAKEHNQIKIRKNTFEQQKKEAVNEVRRMKEQFKTGLQAQRAESYVNAQYRK